MNTEQVDSYICEEIRRNPEWTDHITKRAMQKIGFGVCREMRKEIKKLQKQHDDACIEFESFAVAEGYHGVAVGEILDDNSIKITGCQGTRYELEKENKELKKALEFYADKSNYWNHNTQRGDGHYVSTIPAMKGQGEVARKALGSLFE